MEADCLSASSGITSLVTAMKAMKVGDPADLSTGYKRAVAIALLCGMDGVIKHLVATNDSLVVTFGRYVFGAGFVAETGSGHLIAMDGAPDGGGRTT